MHADGLTSEERARVESARHRVDLLCLAGDAEAALRAAEDELDAARRAAAAGRLRSRVLADLENLRETTREAIGIA